MRSLANIIGIVLIILFFLLVPVSIRMRDVADNLELYASEAVDDMLSDIYADGRMTEERLLLLSSLLYSCGYQHSFELTEYYYEEGLDGNTYQYSVTFDEICTELSVNGFYKFKEDSYICIQVPGYSPENLVARILYGRRPLSKSIKL